MPQFAAQIDALRIPIKGLVPEQNGAALGSPVEGLLWHDTGTKHVFCYLNGGWVQLDNVAGGVTDGDKGDIVVSGGGTVWTIDNNAVNSAKIQDGTVVVGDTATSFDLGALASAHPTTTDVALNNHRITGLADPQGVTDAANKQYVDGVAAGLDPKQSVKAASTISVSLNGAATFDGIVLATGDRALVKDQITQSQNGIYIVNTAGAWTRATDMDAWAEVPGAFVFVEQGTNYADTGWVSTADQGGTIGTTAITWSQFSGAGQVIAGAGLSKTGNTLDVNAGTGITTAGDQVGLDTTYTDGRYWNVTGDSGLSGAYAFLSTPAPSFTMPDSTQPQNTRIDSQQIGWTAVGGAALGGLTMSNDANKLMRLYYPSGKILVDCPDVTFNGDAKGVTPTAGDNDTSLATTAFVNNAIATSTSVTPSSRNLVAGAGLTGGGDLTADRTFNVGGSTSITVAADSIAVAPNGIDNSMIADGAINLGTADVTGTLPIAKGGTGATTAAAARTALGVPTIVQANVPALPTPGTYVTVPGIVRPGGGPMGILTVGFGFAPGGDTAGSGEVFLDWKTRGVAEDFQVKADVVVPVSTYTVTVVMAG